jgi:hypothetical protein
MASRSRNKYDGILQEILLDLHVQGPYSTGPVLPQEHHISLFILAACLFTHLAPCHICIRMQIPKTDLPFDINIVVHHFDPTVKH